MKQAGFALLLLITLTAGADPLSGSLQYGTSVSGAYQGRNPFTNPAALGFETELNGTRLETSYTYGFHRTLKDEYALGLSLGYLGFGAEALSPETGRASRFTFATGFPLTHYLFLGARYRLFRPTAGVLPSYDAIDLGAQLRLHPRVSLGVVANQLNRPSQVGYRLPIQYVLGASVRPIDRLEFNADIDTLSSDNAKRYGYQAILSVEAMRGVFVRGGYHSDHRWQAGLQINLGMVALSSTVQPGAGERRANLGVQTGTSLFRSAIEPPLALHLLLDGSLGEEGTHPSFLSKGKPSLVDILQLLSQAQTQPSIRRVFIDLDNFALGLAAAEELAAAIARVRAAGKEVEVFLGRAGIKEYLIASAATRITLSAAGEIKFAGLSSQKYFLKGTLDKIGVEAEFLARGEYKSAPEMFTRKDSSQVSRQTTLDLLKSAETNLLSQIARYRKLPNDTWATVKARVLISATEAKSLGLIDAVGDASRELPLREKTQRLVDKITPLRDDLALPSKVAVVFAEGNILPRKFRLLSFAGERQLTPERLEKEFRRALGDSRTKAIVLRVSSPGGEILASHQMAGVIEEANRQKPVLISMGDVAASGGYYISAPAKRIFADALTLTGSIGVFLGKFNLSGLFQKIDLHKEILSDSTHAGIDSEDRAWTAAQRAIMVRRLDSYYTDFVGFVAAQRKQSPADVDKVARGRVWLGEHALARHLTDSQGGLREALQQAALDGGIEGDDYEVWQLRETAPLFDLFGGDALMAKVSERLAFSLLGTGALRDLAWMAALREYPFLYFSPVVSLTP